MGTMRCAWVHGGFLGVEVDGHGGDGGVGGDGNMEGEALGCG